MKYSAGAEERTRTSMGLLPLAPEASASTNFATSAYPDQPDSSGGGALYEALGHLSTRLANISIAPARRTKFSVWS